MCYSYMRALTKKKREACADTRCRLCQPFALVISSCHQRAQQMVYTTLPSLKSWWHNVNQQQSATPIAASPSAGCRSFGQLRHGRISRTEQNASSHVERRQTPQKTALHAHVSAQRKVHRQKQCCTASASNGGVDLGITLNADDTNQLQTALNQAIAAEDYALASKLRDQLQKLVGRSGTADWRQLGVPEWLADRVERMGYKFATGGGLYQSAPAVSKWLQPCQSTIRCLAEVQKQAAAALKKGRDVIIQSQTGSGKTLAFLLPLLSRLDYPPDLYPEDLKASYRPPCFYEVASIFIHAQTHCKLA